MKMEMMPEKAGPSKQLELDEQIASLEAAGMSRAAEGLKKDKEMRRKLALAYRHYCFVRPEEIEAYIRKLREAIRVGNERSGTDCMTLALTKIDEYDKVPPQEVLLALKEAREMGCFDRFEVAHILVKREIPDPVVFGIVDGCKDKFFVAQWDNDARIEKGIEIE